MSLPSHNQPYSQQGLERLAVALGVNKAQIWHDPCYHRLEIKQLNREDQPAANQIEELEDEEE